MQRLCSITYDDFVFFDGDLLSILHMVRMYIDTYLIGLKFDSS
jgi:hypothetical protein